MEVEGVGKVLPYLAEVQMIAIEEHLHLPLGQAQLIVQTKLEFSLTSDGLDHCSR